MTLARDSLQMLRASSDKVAKASKVASKLELARDSLEYMKEVSKMSFGDRRASEPGNADEKSFGEEGIIITKVVDIFTNETISYPRMAITLSQRALKRIVSRFKRLLRKC